MNGDDPIPLAKASELFPNAKLTVSTLRAEAQRGNLTIFRIGRRDYTTAASMREMVRKLQENGRRRANPFFRTRDDDGLTEAQSVAASQAALKRTIEQRRKRKP